MTQVPLSVQLPRYCDSYIGPSREPITTNYFGVIGLKKKNNQYDQEEHATNGSCHAAFHRLLVDHRHKYTHAWLSTTYNGNLFSNFGTTLDENEKRVLHRKFMEFALTPETSPWKDFLENFEYSIVYNNNGGINGVVFPLDQKINVVPMFYMFKGLRGMRESRGELFFDAIRRGITDVKLLRAYYILSFYLVPSIGLNHSSKGGIKYVVAGAHDHIAFKHSLNVNPFNQTMVCDFNDHPLNSGSLKYYGDFNQGNYCFNLGPVQYLDNQEIMAKIKKNLDIKTEAPKNEVQQGYFIKVTKHPYFMNQTTNNISGDDIFNNPMAIIGAFTESDKKLKVIQEYLQSSTDANQSYKKAA